MPQPGVGGVPISTVPLLDYVLISTAPLLDYVPIVTAILLGGVKIATASGIRPNLTCPIAQVPYFRGCYNCTGAPFRRCSNYTGIRFGGVTIAPAVNLNYSRRLF